MYQNKTMPQEKEGLENPLEKSICWSEISDLCHYVTYVYSPGGDNTEAVGFIGKPDSVLT